MKISGSRCSAYACAVLIVLLPCLPAPVPAVTLSGDQELKAGAVLNGDGAGNQITPTAVSEGYQYDWGDVDGAGSGTTGVATPGLDLRGYKVWNTTGEDVILDLNGGDISGTGTVAISLTRSGDVSAATLKTAGDLTITNVGNIAMGKVVTTHSGLSGYNDYARSGHVVIGENTPSGRAGNIRIDSIDTRQTYGANNDYRSGNVTIDGNGDVLIQTSGGTAGSILAYQPHSDGGTIVIRHDGAFRANNLHTYTDSTWISENAGNITLEGDCLADGADGMCQINTITAYSFFSTGYSGRGGQIQISGYTGVDVAGNIDTYTSALGNSLIAGDVTIEEVSGDITLHGTVNLNTANPAQRDGRLVLACGGTATLESDLDCALVDYASFNSGAGRSYIAGALLNFSATNDCLRAATGQKILYDPKLPANAYLGGNTYPLLQPNGSPGGGKLAAPDQGTVVVFR